MSSKDVAAPVYRIVFNQQAEVYEIYARHVYQSDLYGFVEVEQLVFGEKSSVVLDPGEEKLKTTFADVKRTFIPMHAVIRIDEVSKEGQPSISPSDGSNVAFLKTPGLSGKGPGKGTK